MVSFHLSEIIGLKTLFSPMQYIIRSIGGAIGCTGGQGSLRENAGRCTESPGRAALGEETSRQDGRMSQVRSKRLH